MRPDVLMKTIVPALVVSMLTAMGAPSLALAQQEKLAAAPAEAKAPAKSNGLDAELNAAIVKSNAYIELMNRTLRAVESWQRYASWVNVQKGPTGKERYIDYGLYGLYDVKDEIAKAREVMAKPPQDAGLDQAFSRYIEAYEALAPLITSANGYYERKDYKSDKMAEGKALHAKLVPAAKEFIEARADIEASMRTFKRDIDKRALAAIAAKEGQGPAWHVKSVMMAAQDVVETLPQAKGFDLKAFDASLDVYAKTVREFDLFAEAYPSKFSGFESQPRSLLGKLRDIRDKLAKSKGKVTQFIGMDLTFLITSYNMMVSTSQMATRFGK